MSKKVKAILVNTGVVLLGIYGTLGMAYLYAWVIPLMAPIVSGIMMHFLLIPVGAALMLFVVMAPLSLLALVLIFLTEWLHKLIGLECCK